MVEAKHRETKKKVAIKYVPVNTKDSQCLKYIIRELAVLKHMSEIENNIYSTKLVDIKCHKNEKGDLIGIFYVQEFMASDLKKLISFS